MPAVDTTGIVLAYAVCAALALAMMVGARRGKGGRRS